MGAGHNGLVAAAYLAKAGKKVLVLERKPWPGGGVVTREINTPGYWHDEHSSVHIMIQGNPMIRRDELGLQSRFGLKYQYNIPYAMIFPDQTTLVAYQDLDKTCEQIARISPRDAETYRRFAKRAMAMLPMFASGLYVPPTSLGAMVSMLDSSEDGREVLDAMQRSSLEIANQSFESEKVKVWLVRLVTENLQMPDELGTGFGLYLMPGLMHGFGVSQPVGGSGKLSESLVRCIEHYGGEVRCNSEVTRILTSSGRATGVRLSTGEEFTAKDGVIGAIHPHRLRAFLDGVPEPVLVRAERASLAAFSIMVSHYDLKEPARFRAGEEVSHAIMLEFMASDPSNPSSIHSCLNAARENARAVRGTLTTEVWETINSTWLELKTRMRSVEADPSQFFEWVKYRSHLSRGVTIGTMLKDEALYFSRLGTFLERADNTARILDVKYHALADQGAPDTGAEGDGGRSIDFYHWAAVLRSVSAFEVYRKVYSNVITPARVAELLILREDMPRSLANCVNEVVTNLASVRNDHSRETERRAGLLQADLHYGRIDAILQQGLHAWLVNFLQRVNDLGDRISRDFLVPLATA